MSDVTVEKTPKGYKRCPKCSGLVKGPRTKVCTHCRHEFAGKVNAPAKPAKAKVIAVVVEPEPVKPTIVPDPFTFSLSAALDPGRKVKSAYIVRRASGVVNLPNATVTAMRYSEAVQVPSPAVFENDVVMA